MRALVLGCVVLATFGCRRRTTEAVRPAIPVDIADAGAPGDGAVADTRVLTEFEAQLADVPPFGDDERRAVCGRRPDCRVSRSASAGVDARGRALTLVTALDFPIHADADGHDFPEFRFEHWLLASEGGHLVQRQLLFTDGHPDPDFAETHAADGLKVKGARIHCSYLWPGISGRFRGDKAHVVTIDPLRLERIDWPGWDAFTPGAHWSYDIDLNTLIGTESWDHPACADAPPPAISARMVVIPRLDVDAGYDAAWRTTSIARCSARVDGISSGFVLSGSPAVDDASFFVLAVGGSEVIVEIHDDVIRAGDQLEIWTSDDAAGMGMHCMSTKKASRFRVDVTTGSTTPAGGPLVELAPGARPRLRVRFAESTAGFAFAYRDTDDGTRVKRVIASSRIRTEWPAELQSPRSIRREDARCRFTDSELVLERPEPDSLRPIAEGY